MWHHQPKEYSDQRIGIRHAYTLVELMVATLSASILVAGLGSSLVVATRAFDDTASQPMSVLESNRVAESIMNQMQYATRFYEKTATAVTFEVPDRDGDGFDEKFRYAWSGVVGDPLVMEYNNSAPATLIASVQELDFTYLTKTFDVVEVSATQQVQYEEMAEVILDSKDDEITLTLPAGTSEGDLLIASVATDNDRTDSIISVTAGWNPIAISNSDGKVTLGVWWKNATASESAPLFSWSGDEEAYGWIMRFTNHNATNPINDWATLATIKDVTLSPVSPAVAPTEFNCMILRLCGIDKDGINVGDTGLTNHTTITMQSADDKVSGGAGYRYWPQQGNTGTANFELTDAEDIITVTLAIAPDGGT